MSRRVRIGCIALVLVAAAGTSVALWSPPDWLLDSAAERYPGCVYRASVRAPVIALTIDDGPDSVTTPLILAELARHQARATFFLISGRVEGREWLVRAMVSAGHEIGNHLPRDEPSIGLTSDQFEEALLEAHEVLARYGPIAWVRPGSGWYSQSMIDAIHRRGYRCAMGSVYPFDAHLPSVRFVAGYILRNARPGAVVILHDGGSRGRRTARVLREVLPELQRRGYQVVTLSELVGAG